MASDGATTGPPPSIAHLLTLAADKPADVLQQLQQHPSLAGAADEHGYSLVHAAASYGHEALLRALINDYHVDANIADEDDETALFSVEDVAMAGVLLELRTDPDRRNAEGMTAAEKFAAEGEYPEIAAFLRKHTSGLEADAGEEGQGEGSEVTAAASASSAAAPPRLPDGVRINVGTMREADVGEEPDPEFRRRIEELAAREDFDHEEGQRELRNLITDAVSGLTGESGQGSATRVRRE